MAPAAMAADLHQLVVDPRRTVDLTAAFVDLSNRLE
jgi:hypothetical protein